MSDVAAEEAPMPVRVALRGATELIDDPAITQVYGSATWFAGASVAWPIAPQRDAGPVVEVEAAWHRATADASTLRLVPLSALFEWQTRRLVYFGIGPTFTVFQETHPLVDGVGVTSGGRIAGELRAGIRVDTGLVDPPMPPAPTFGPRAIEFELYVSRRSELPGRPEGFDLGAWRGAVGLVLCF